jgi:hypothetical protein
MQVTAFVSYIRAKRRGSAVSTPAVELTAESDGLSSILLLGSDDDMIKFLGRIADLFGYEVTKRDPGPCCCAYGDFYEREGLMAPVHDCPAPEPTIDERFDEIVHDLGLDATISDIIDHNRDLGAS